MQNIKLCTKKRKEFGFFVCFFKRKTRQVEWWKKLNKNRCQKINNVSIANKNKQDVRGIYLTIQTNKEKKPTVKNNAGKILEYQINLNSNIIISDFLTEKLILNQEFNYSISYKVQDEHSETIKLENKNIENLVDKTYQDILIKISEYIAKQ